MFVLQILERNEVVHSLSPASSRCATFACSHRMRSWPRGGTPDRLSHTASSFFTRRPHSWSCVVRHTHSCLPPRRARSCGFLSLLLNLGQCARGWSSARVSKASYIETVHELHQHLRPFACEMLCAQVRRVCFRRDLLLRQLVVADRP